MCKFRFDFTKDDGSSINGIIIDFPYDAAYMGSYGQHDKIRLTRHFHDVVQDLLQAVGKEMVANRRTMYEFGKLTIELNTESDESVPEYWVEYKNHFYKIICDFIERECGAMSWYPEHAVQYSNLAMIWRNTTMLVAFDQVDPILKQINIKRADDYPVIVAQYLTSYTFGGSDYIDANRLTIYSPIYD